MADDGKLILTYPSPAYQRQLYEQNRSELQIIDEIVEFDALATHAAAEGLFVKHFSLEDVWLSNQYVHCVFEAGDIRLKPLPSSHGSASAEIARTAIAEIEHIAGNRTVILVDEEQWRAFLPSRLRTLPFIEQAGQYWGPPADDESAIQEFERLRNGGAAFIAFAAPAFWWLGHYAKFNQYLNSQFRRIPSSDALIVFDVSDRTDTSKA
jgi:hypothetical protein